MDSSDRNKDDINKIINYLKFDKQTELATLLTTSYSRLIVSNTFGTKNYSMISTFQIFSSPDKTEKLQNLSDKEKQKLMKAVHLIYPIKESSPEITSLEFYPDLDLIDYAIFADSQNIDNCPYEHVREQLKKCKEKINLSDYDGAVTNARSLIESLCLYILSKKGNTNKFEGNLGKIYKETFKVLKMEQNLYDDGNLKKIIQGSASIIDGMAGLRNDYGDAHGKAPNSQYKISKRHALLIVNLSISISEFLIASFNENENL